MDTSRTVPEVKQEDSLNELKSSVRWAVGNKKWNPKRKKYEKPPICPITGKKLSVSKPGEWVCSYEEALAAQIKYGYDYIGFLLTKDDPYHLTDPDKVIDEESRIDPRAMKIIKEQNTYAEVSLSGKGLHSIGLAIKPDGQMCKPTIDGLPVESYDRVRFVVFTGNVINDEPIRDVQEWVDENVPFKSTSTVEVTPNPVDATDEEIIKLALSSKNGEKFRKLFHEGDISLYNDDHSQADMALCGTLAYWTGKDPERMDRIFRSSKLYRNKWDREGYRDRTINEAIENCTSIYNPKGKEELLGKLHSFRINSQWKEPSCYFLYGAFLQTASIAGWYVPGEGIYVYVSIRDLNLGSNIVKADAKDFIYITRTWRKLQEAGLVKEISKGGARTSSLYLLPESSVDSIRPTIRETQGCVNKVISYNAAIPVITVCPPPVYPIVGQNESNPVREMDVSQIQRIPWLPDLNKKQKMLIEQIHHGRNSLEDLATYFGKRKNNFKSRNLKPLLNMGLLRDDDGLYVLDEKAVHNRFVYEGGLDSLNQYVQRKSMDTIEYKIDGEEANYRRSLQKADAYERGEIEFSELSRYEKDVLFIRAVAPFMETKPRVPVLNPPADDESYNQRIDVHLKGEFNECR